MVGETSAKKPVIKRKRASVDPSKYWRIATIALFAIIVFMFFFNIEIEPKFGSESSPKAGTSGVSTQGSQNAPSTRNVPPPQGGGGCGV